MGPEPGGGDRRRGDPRQAALSRLLAAALATVEERWLGEPVSEAATALAAARLAAVPNGELGSVPVLHIVLMAIDEVDEWPRFDND